MSNAFNLIGRGLVLAYTIGHAFVVVSLIAFGLRADGWVLHPLAVASYAAFVVGSLFGMVRHWRDDGSLLLVIPPLLALCALEAFAVTGALGGAAYAPYGLSDLDAHDLYVALNLIFGLALAAFALLYRWERLLRVGVIAQASLVLTYPVLWFALMQSLATGPNFLLTGTLAVGVALVLVYALTGRVLTREREPERRFPWEVLVPALWFAVSFFTPELRVGAALPAAGTQIGGTQTVVPDAWLPTIFWAEWLFNVLGWLLVPYALLGLVMDIRRGIPLNRAALAFPRVLLLAGAAWLAFYARDFSAVGFPLRPLREHLPPSVTTQLLPLAGALVLFAASRAWERKWNGLAEFCWRAVTLGGLAAFLVANAQDAWSYARVLSSPLPAWERYWAFAPFSPALLAIIGLLAQFVVIGVGLIALVQALRAWFGATAARPTALARNIALPLVGIAALLSLASWLLQPKVIRTVPSNGAVDVPRDTQIYVELGAEKPWVSLQSGTMAGIWAHYSDTGEPLQGMTAGSGSGKLMIKPADLLRPNAAIEVTVFRSGEQPYTFRFQTGVLNNPTATPLPQPPGFPRPAPTPQPATP